MLASAPVAKTTHFVLYRLPVALAASAQSSASATSHAVNALPMATGPWHKAKIKAKADDSDLNTANQSPAAPLFWVGALLPKRWARHAVTRNLIRRQVYAVAGQAHQQTHQQASQAAGTEPLAYLVRLRASFHQPFVRRQGGQTAKGSASANKPHRHAGQTAAAHSLPESLPRSAGSALLKAQVRSELQQLFQRSQQAGNAPSARNLPVEAARGPTGSV